MEKEMYLKNKADVVEESFERLTIYTYMTTPAVSDDISMAGRPGVLVWRGKQSKPCAYYAFKSLAHRASWIENLKANEKADMDDKRERQAKKKAFKNPFKVGDILTGSWGYDQTNPEAVQVVEVKNKSVVIKSIGFDTVEGSSGFMSCSVVPVKDKFLSDKDGELKRVLCSTYSGGNEGYVKLHRSCSVSLWDGSSMYNSWYA